MFIHHVVTLLLLALSWVCNLHRVGSLVLVVHDCADIFLDVSWWRRRVWIGFQRLILLPFRAGGQADQVYRLPEGVRLHFRLFHGALDRDASGLLSSHHLQQHGGGAAHSADVPGLLHFQQYAVHTAVPACCLDVCDPADCAHCAQVRTG